VKALLVHLPAVTPRDAAVRHGHFDNSRREYVITRPDTPLPWIYCLGTGTFFRVIPNTAGGYSCYRDARYPG
jgi:cellobiose phosphorylase